MKSRLAFLLLIIAVASFSCKKNEAKYRLDTKTTGEATIAVDETLAPIVNELIYVFERVNSGATITPIEIGEVEAYKLFVDDSVRVLVGFRELNNVEQYAIKKRKQNLRMRKLAVDGVALIVNKNNPDSLFQLDAVKKIMSGEITRWDQVNADSKLGEIEVIFDRPNSSLARYISDSIVGSTKLSPNVRAIAKDFSESNTTDSLDISQKIITYVKNKPNAIGVLGVNWISDPREDMNYPFITDVAVAGISNPKVPLYAELYQQYYKPYAANLGIGYYPLSRNVYIMITDIPNKLPSGFVSFALGENGQRMINKCGLFPATIPTRVIRVNTDMNDYLEKQDKKRY